MPDRTDSASPPAIRLFLRGAALLAAVALLVLYFAQHSRLPPNSVDGALIFDYLEEMCAGKLPYWDFVDIYGPLNWPLPLLFYALAGQEVWGVRLWMIVLKIISVGATYLLVKRLANLFYALLAAFCVAVLLGQPFQFLQTPYASHTSYPLVLFVWYFIICSPLRRPYANSLTAAALTAALLWIKLNAGLFLFLGGLFYYFYWLPPPGQAGNDAGRRWQPGPGARRWLAAAQMSGLVFYGLVFLIFIRKYFDILYFLYLTAPLLLALAWTLDNIRKERGDRAAAALRLTRWLFYLGATAAFWFAFFMLYYGWDGGLHYLWEIITILTRAAYTHPVPHVGVEGFYRDFNRWYWLQLPWLLTFVFCLWLTLQNERRAQLAFAERRKAVRAQASGLFVMVSLYAYVMYPRSDEPHMYQAMLPCLPVFFVLLFQLDRMLLLRRAKWVRGALAAAVLAACTTIATVPRLDAVVLKRGHWYGHRLRYLKFRPRYNPAVKNTSSEISDYDWDMAINQTGLCVDALTLNESEVLILTSNQLINYHSHTKPVGGRYRYLFYLLRNDLIDRETFELMVPAYILRDLLQSPPRVIVSALGDPPLLAKIPEFKKILKQRYYIVQVYAHILIYLPLQERLPPDLCE